MNAYLSHTLQQDIVNAYFRDQTATSVSAVYKAIYQVATDEVTSGKRGRCLCSVSDGVQAQARALDGFLCIENGLL